MRNHNLGYPRIGNLRETKKACEQYWAGKITVEQLLQESKNLRKQNLLLQKQLGIELIPVNDFSLYDQVLDMSLMLNNIPERYRPVFKLSGYTETEIYFAMARGYQKNGLDIPAMEMTKWMDTNYHYIVPEFEPNQNFKLFSHKVFDEFLEAKELGVNAKPVLLGPISYLLLGKEKKEGYFNRFDLLDSLLDVYVKILQKLSSMGAKYIQLDEPCLVTDLSAESRQAYVKAYNKLKKSAPQLSIILASYFGSLDDNTQLALSLPVDVLHLDLCRAPEQLDTVLDTIPDKLELSLGIIDGRNIWINNYNQSLALINKAKAKIGEDRLWLAPSCSLLHVPCDLDLEDKNANLPKELKHRMSFAKQKLIELTELCLLSSSSNNVVEPSLSPLGVNPEVKKKLARLKETHFERKSPFGIRKQVQQAKFKLPAYATTTIGSFPQTKEVRATRAKFRKGEITAEEYDKALKEFTKHCIDVQEEIGLDVLVHGEFERTDMVEYFGEKLDGFAFTTNGWVQSYGSRCVKPPVIFGDISRPTAMTVYWSKYAQSLTEKPMKGMLTGPITILQWSFVRTDQPRSETAFQIALAIREEVQDLEAAGIKVIQIDEPALREGLPLRRKGWKEYLDWAVKAFKLSASGVSDETQIHTHMCYAEFNDIIEAVAALDADVITIETARSQMELLDAFTRFKYPNSIGPGVYDIHSPRVPSVSEIVRLMEKAEERIPSDQLWVNPDCGLKTRAWEETKASLQHMVQAAKILRT